ncbi:MAG: ankyrin repeat domain-containing protein [bacterium]
MRDQHRLSTPEQFSLLCEYARMGQCETMIELIEEAPEIVKYHDQTGMTPMMYAAQEGTFDAAVILHKHGGNLTEFSDEGLSAVHYAARRETPELLVYFFNTCDISVDIHDRYGSTPIVNAVGFNRLAVVKYLCEDAKCQTDGIHVGGALRMDLINWAAYSQEMGRCTPREDAANAVYYYLEEFLGKSA